MAYSEKEYKKHILLGQSNNALVLLVAINMVIFIAFAFLRAVYHLQTEDNTEALRIFHSRVLDWFTLPASTDRLLSRPWTILTHMFLHESVWHVIGNMLWLWIFGYILQDLTGNRKIIPIYLYGAFAGAVAFILSYNFIPSLHSQLAFATITGGSAAIMAIAMSVTAISPGYRIFPMLNGGIPVWIVTGIYIIIDMALIPDENNTGGHIAHLAGAFTGFLFVYFYQRGYDWGGWMNNFFDWVGNLFNPDRPPRGTSIKEELFYRSNTRPYKKTPNVTTQRVDEILDKISQNGYHSLTDEEKDLLKRASKENL